MCAPEGSPQAACAPASGQVPGGGQRQGEQREEEQAVGVGQASVDQARPAEPHAPRKRGLPSVLGAAATLEGCIAWRAACLARAPQLATHGLELAQAECCCPAESREQSWLCCPLTGSSIDLWLSAAEEKPLLLRAGAS